MTPSRRFCTFHPKPLLVDLALMALAFFLAFLVRRFVLLSWFMPRGWMNPVYLERDIFILPLLPPLAAAALVASSFYEAHRLRHFLHALVVSGVSFLAGVVCFMALVYMFAHEKLVSRWQIGLMSVFSILFLSLRWRVSRQKDDRRRLNEGGNVPVHAVVAPFPILMPFDLVLMIMAFMAAHLTRQYVIEPVLAPFGLIQRSWFTRHIALLPLYPVIMLVTLGANSFYDMELVRRLRQAAWVLVISTLEATAVLMAVVYLFAHEHLVTRWQIILMAGYMNLFLVVRWLAVRRIFHRRDETTLLGLGRPFDGSNPFQRVPVGGLLFHACRMDQAVEWLADRIRHRAPAFVVTPNLDWLYMYNAKPDLRGPLQEADLVLADGVPIFWLSQFMNPPLPEKISGSDLFMELCGVSAREGFRIYLLGGAAGVGEQARERLMHLFPKIKICGIDAPPHGFLQDATDWERVIGRIQSARPNIVFVALDAENQIRFIIRAMNATGVPVWMGVGATIDFIAGRQRRAPRFMQQAGLEWFWRLACHPRRLFRRYVLNDLPFLLRLVWRMIRPAARNGVPRI